MPVHNGADFVSEAIMSINPAGDMPFEVIVIDDASRDETGNIVNDLARHHGTIQYVRVDENVGPGNARNLGLEIAQGELIGFLDADDRYAPGGIQRLCEHLHQHRTTDVVMGTVCALRRSENSNSTEEFEPTNERARVFQLGSVVVRRHVIDCIGGFDPAYRHGEDIDWFLRLQESRARIDQVGALVLHHRRHERNMSVVEPNGALDIASVMQASIRRRVKLAEKLGIDPKDIYSIKPGPIKAGGADDLY